MDRAPHERAPLPGWVACLGSLLAGSLLGAAAMALADPVGGPPRRARLQARGANTLASLRRHGSPVARACGDEAEAVALPEPAAEEARLVARVRQLLGRVCENARAIEVRLCDGVVELHGLVLRVEHRRVVRGVRRMYGVREVRNFLRPYDCHARVEDEHLVH